MKRCVWIALLLLTGACRETAEERREKFEESRNVPPPYRVVTIEGCEYLRLESTHGYAVLTHKGNCRNPIHCRVDTAAQRPDEAGR